MGLQFMAQDYWASRKDDDMTTDRMTFDEAKLAFMGLLDQQDYDAWAERACHEAALDIVVEGVPLTRDTGNGQGALPVRAHWRAFMLKNRMLSALLAGYVAPRITDLVPASDIEVRAAYREFMTAAGRVGAYWAAHGPLNHDMRWNSVSWRVIGDVPRDEQAGELLEEARAALRAFARRYLYRMGLDANADPAYQQKVRALGVGA